jgi:2-keto-4-pentenoate hydratase/2-oxohepta-3-ene-1,7-dioic acid hydratase in catechol pathway
MPGHTIRAQAEFPAFILDEAAVSTRAISGSTAAAPHGPAEPNADASPAPIAVRIRWNANATMDRASSTMAIGIPTLIQDMSPEMSGALYEHPSPFVHA